MAVLVWDQIGEKTYETGVDHCVLYLPNVSGVYDTGFAWNGITTITESPSGAESNPQYADNMKYINLLSAEDFGCTLEAFTYPDQFAQCDGSVILAGGVSYGQQARRSFGLSYRTLKGNDINGTAYGYKLHLVYGAQAAPSEKAYGTVNDSPEAAAFSWDLTTTPVSVGTLAGTTYKPTAIITIDSTDVDPTKLAAFETILYGSAGVEPRLPLPAEVYSLFTTTVTVVSTALVVNAPSYNSSTHVVTLPAVTGLTWRVNGVVKTAGAQPAMTAGQSSLVTATTNSGYVFSADSVDRWAYAY